MSFTRVHLFDSYYYREVSPEEFGPFFRENRSKVFSDTLTIDVDVWTAGEDLSKILELNKRVKDRYTLQLYIMKGEEIIGWHTGRQFEGDHYHMSNTGIFEEYRGKGIYSALLPKLLELFREKGFQKVSSRHNVANNAVLVPKLKAGFVITGFEIDERFGLLVVLSYIYGDKRLKAYKFRTGQIRPDEDLMKFL